MIYFSSYGKVRNLRKFVTRFYSISIGNGGYGFKKIRAFVPDWDLVRDFKNNKISWKEYEAFYYMNMIENLKGKEEIIKEWCKKNNGVCLLCFESNDRFCHRRIVREYLQSLGIACAEA